MYLGTVIASLIGYLIGSLSFSIWIVWAKTRKDVRQHGSKNAGATNASRILGKKWGVLIVVLDAFKPVVSAFIAMSINTIPSELFNQTSYIIPAFFALVGHCYPVYYKFKGGKAVSCFMGLAFIANGFYALIFLIVWYVVIFAYRRVSLSSVLGVVFVMGVCWVPQLYGFDSFNTHGFITFSEAYDKGWYANFMNVMHDWNGNPNNFYDSILTIAIMTTLGGTIVIFKHGENITRLIKGEEAPFFEYDKEKRAAKKALKAKIKQDNIKTKENYEQKRKAE